MKNPDRPPRVGLKFALRALLACILVMVLTGTAVATVALRELDDILDPIRRDGRADIDIPELDVPDPGGPRTFLMLGSDARDGDDAGMSPRSDTIMLVRVDPDKDAIAVMSIPRDLKVEIPGHGEGKINSAYEIGGKKGGPRLVVRTVKKLFEDATGERFPITNVIIMDFGAFRRAVNYIDGVYVDIDRDYFNDNSSGENYATIDVNAGYQKLQGKDALDYVRYRHTDNDLVRAARQQDFLRQAKNAAGVRKLLASGLTETKHLIRVFGRYFQVDKSLRSNKQILSMLKLVLYLSNENPKVHEVRVQGLRRAEPAARLEPLLPRRRPAALVPPVHAGQGVRHPAREHARGAGGAADRQAAARAQAAQGTQQAVAGHRARGRAARGRGPGRDRRSQAQVPVLLPGAAHDRLGLLRHRAAHLQDRATSAARSARRTASSSRRGASASTTASRA